MGLGCAQAHIILAVILGMTNTKEIVSKIRWIKRRETLCGHQNGGEISSGKLQNGDS